MISRLRHQPLKHQTALLFPAVKIIVDVPGWGCGGSQRDCLGLEHVWSQAQVCYLHVINFQILTSFTSPLESPWLTLYVRCAQVYMPAEHGTQSCFRACAHNYRHEVVVLMLLLDTHSQAPETCQSQNCWCFLPSVCERWGVLRGSFCNLPGGLLL